MNNALQPLHNHLRLLKNSWVQKYLHYRIYQNSDPYKIAMRRKPYRMLWILSHMRSGSSLLTHILNTNPAIIGYGETHIRYQSDRDIKKLISKVYWQSQEYRNLADLQKLKLQEQYILDKLLHNNKITNVDLLTSDNLYAIFLIREPQRSLMSILDLKPEWTEKQALQYYCNRLNKLPKYAEKIQDLSRMLLISHEQLINDSPSVFIALQKKLGTTEGFTEEYKILKQTGSKHVGDHRGKLMAGQIIRTPRELKQSVSKAALDEAMAVYRDCYTQLSQCSSLVLEPKPL